jgi:hypothetical protein
MASIFDLGSTATTRPARGAMARLNRPGPDPTSSTVPGVRPRLAAPTAFRNRGSIGSPSADDIGPVAKVRARRFQYRGPIAPRPACSRSISPSRPSTSRRHRSAASPTAAVSQ